MPDQHVLLAYNPGRQTWERKNGLWTQVSDTGPNPTGGLVYDESRARGIAMGLSPIGTGYLETWEWDGTAWTVVADTGPSTRLAFALTYDATNKMTVLFGGMDMDTSTATIRSDTWTWDGTQWKQVSDIRPAGRISAGFTHDATQGRSLLFGGTDWTTTPTTLYRDIWAWDGRLWRQLGDIGPTPRGAVGLCYDRVRERAVLFGGWNSTQVLGDTWEYFDHT
jgi:hypothetical protein